MSKTSKSSSAGKISSESNLNDYENLTDIEHALKRPGMYIGSVKKCAKTIQQIQQRGLFVEEFISPYLEEFTIDD